MERKKICGGLVDYFVPSESSFLHYALSKPPLCLYWTCSDNVLLSYTLSHILTVDCGTLIKYKVRQLDDSQCVSRTSDHISYFEYGLTLKYSLKYKLVMCVLFNDQLVTDLFSQRVYYHFLLFLPNLFFDSEFVWERSASLEVAVMWMPKLCMRTDSNQIQPISWCRIAWLDG